MHIAIDRLIQAIKEKGNPTVLGLDTRIEHIPQGMAAPAATHKDAASAIYDYNVALVDALCDLVPAVKVQIAYYEMLGFWGLEAFAKTLSYAKSRGLIAMADAKRNDIGATAEAYAAAYLTCDAPFDADFLTVNPYLGSDGILPFVNAARQSGKGLFVLAKTSNPSSGEFQDIDIDGNTLYEKVGDKIALWGQEAMGELGYSSVGAVVGATYPEEGVKLRARLPQVFFLVPGYGAQGATGKDLKGCFDKEGSGAIVNASRSLLMAHKKHAHLSFKEATRLEATTMREDIMGAIRGES